MPGPGSRPSARASRVRELFAIAVETPPDRRGAFLAAQTAEDDGVLEEVRELLAYDAATGVFSGSAPAPSANSVPLSAPADVPHHIERWIGHYRLDGWIGSGGMGHVFKAWDMALDRPAAVKLIRPDVDLQQAVRLLGEVEASAELQHPAIATFFEGGEAKGVVYLAMELVVGTTLRQRLADGPLPPLDALRVLTGLLEALAHAHATGLLHRDIKPENVMLTSSGQPKLLDFGIAGRLPLEGAAFTAVATKTSRLIGTAWTGGAAGTPGYMSPEQLRGEPLTPASDVFQAGLLLFEMLSGQRAFQGSTIARIAATLAGPPDLAPIARLLPHGLSALAAKALAFDPADRFHSAASFLRHVDALVDGRLRGALPESLVVVDFESTASGPAAAPMSGADPLRSADDGRDWAGGAVAETLRSHLSRLGGVRVVSGPHVSRLLAARPDAVHVGLTLGVRWVVAGQCRRDGDQLRVTARLLDTSTAIEARAWETSGSLGEILAQPEALAGPIVEALTLRPAAIQSPNIRQGRAVEVHLMARQLWQSGSRDAHPRVFALLDEALAASPDFVPALALLAAAHATSFIATRDPSDLARATAAADRAISLDAGCAEAWSWRAYALLRQQRVEEALTSYEHATRAGDDPTASYLYGSTLASIGRFEAALPHLQKAVTLEPRYGIGWLSLGWTLHSLLREEAARFAMHRAKALEGQPGPTFVAGVGGYLAECLRSLGELDRARTEAVQGLASIERSDHSYRDTIRAFCLGALGRVALAQGEMESARAAFAQAVAQMRKRTLTLAGGHVFVQAMAGLARATGDRTILGEAMTVFRTREGYSFNAFFGCADDTTAFELALTAQALGAYDDAERFLAQARAAGSRRPFAPVEGV